MGTLLVAAGVAAAITLLVAWLVRSRGGPVVEVADELRTDLSPAEAESRVAPLLGGARKVDVQLVLPGTYRITYQQVSAWAVVIAVLAFPIGLIALWVMRQERTVTVTIVPAGDGSLVRVFGRVHAKLAAALSRALRLQLRVPVEA